jgi:hypothetical protein
MVCESNGEEPKDEGLVVPQPCILMKNQHHKKEQVDKRFHFFFREEIKIFIFNAQENWSLPEGLENLP